MAKKTAIEAATAATESTQSVAGLTPQQLAALNRARAKSVTTAWWQPTVDGDYVIGHLIAQVEGDSQFKNDDGTPKKQTVMQLDQGEKGVIRVAVNVVLATEIARLKPQNGQELIVVYRGQASGGRRGKPAKLFTLEVL